MSARSGRPATGELTLRAGPTTAVLAPDAGASLLTVAHDGFQVLAVPTWAPVDTPAVDGARDPRDWVWAWRGGWQPALPNAGQAATGTPVRQGYHGNASQSPWRVEHAGPNRAGLSWRDRTGLLARREIRVDAGAVRLSASLANTGDEPWRVVVTEHLALGGDLLRGPATLVADSNTGFRRQSLDGAPGDEPELTWPGPAGEQWERLAPGVTPAREAVLRPGGDFGRAGVRADTHQVEVAWDTSSLPYLWVWEELAATEAEPWHGRTTALGLEPSSCPHGGGVDVATARGEAVALPPGQIMTWWVRLSIAYARRMAESGHDRRVRVTSGPAGSARRN